MSTATRKCARCKKFKSLDPHFVGKRPGTVTKVCDECRSEIEARRRSQREVFNAMAAQAGTTS